MKRIKKGLIGLILVALSSTVCHTVLANCVGTAKEGIQQVRDYKELVSLFEKTQHILNEEAYKQTFISYAGHGAAISTGSTTNVQVEGIDEASLVEVDERYIYSCTGEKSVFIVDTKDQMKQVASLVYRPLEYGMEMYDAESEAYRPKGLFLDGDRLTVVVEGYEKLSFEGREEPYSLFASGIDVYDISNRKEPKLLRKLRVEGKLLTSRRIEDQIYLVTTDSVGYYCQDQYDAIDLLPIYSDSAIDDQMHTVDAANIYYSESIAPSSFTTIACMNTSTNDPAAYQITLTDADQFYMNEHAIYLVDEYWDWERYNDDNLSELDLVKSVIMKYNIEEQGVKFTAFSTVSGHTYSQFALDEYQGYLRVATTSERDKQENNVYVLDEKLNKVGSLEGLAKDEMIYSARFEKERCYLVTYEQMDPLFVIDLSEPTNPKVLGTLKIPGFSQYLHPISDKQLIGIGRSTIEHVEKYEDGTERVTGVISNGIKLSLFDNSDPTQPKELNKITIDYYGDSDALEEHTAIMVDQERQLFAIPIRFFENGIFDKLFGEEKEKKAANCDWYDEQFNGAYVFGVEEGKLVQKALLYPCYESELYRKEHISQGRICYIGDILYYIYDENINAYDMNTFALKQIITLK